MKGQSVLEVRMRLHPAQDLLAGIAAMQAFKDQYQGRSNRGASRGSTTITANWLAGVWAEDDFCEGDGGQTFRANGGWGTWSINGRWSLMGDQLTIHMMIATAAGVGLSVMLGAALMGLVFLSSGSGHDEAIEDPFENDPDLNHDR